MYVIHGVSNNVRASALVPKMVPVAKIKRSGTPETPSAARIAQDCKKFVSSCWAILEAKGIVVQGLGNRNGQRAVEGRKGTEAARGGLQQKGAYAGSMWTHSDAIEAEELFFETAKKAKKEQ